MFPRQLFSDLFSEHLPFLKSAPDSIRYDYKVKILFKERPLVSVCLILRRTFPLVAAQGCISTYRAARDVSVFGKHSDTTEL